MKRQNRVVIERVSPQINCGEFFIKRIPGQKVEIWADVLVDGHDLIGASGNVFPNSNLGTYVQNSGNLVFKGAELKTFKGVSSNVCGIPLDAASRYRK